MTDVNVTLEPDDELPDEAEVMLILGKEEVIVLRELLFVTQLSTKGKGAIVAAIAKALDDLGFDPELDEDWLTNLCTGKIITQKSVDTGIYWV
ncbi:hypothetical protein FDI69_gp121 [Rhodococcus phage Trina]|uniref:Uncharacterized protein n=1 Tax=Rhodococcus phage Trina TaxID=2027905 RepID=A0A2D0ZM78_9CAUD|nr:hypothetical protein FDI69_gp121 [Rhodococcus phage Trina]ASZ74935.1 hypothetical protein SEA_TRINA_121 [Rhodococcus phage Trina]